jgi:hypothetical protein
MPILGQTPDTWQLLEMIKILQARIENLERGPAESDAVRLIKVGDASLLMKKDGTIELRGKDMAIRASGQIEIKAGRELILKGSNIREN